MATPQATNAAPDLSQLPSVLPANAPASLPSVLPADLPPTGAEESAKYLKNNATLPVGESLADSARLLWHGIKSMIDPVAGTAKIVGDVGKMAIPGAASNELEATKQVGRDAWAQIKPAFDEVMAHPEEGIVAPLVAQLRPVLETAKTDPMKAIGQLAGMAVLGKTGDELSEPAVKGANAVAKLPKIVGEIPTSLKEARGTVLSPEEADALPPASQVSPILANTPREVLQHAKDIGMTLTPGEATEKALPRTIEAEGERAMATMDPLQKMATANRATLYGSTVNLANRLDPYNLGADDVSAGNAIKQSAKTALDTRRENANQAYGDVKVSQADLAGDISSLKTWADSKLNVRQPHAALTRPEYQEPAVRAALADVADAPERVGKSPSIQSLRNLRTEFYGKANDYTGTIPDAAKAIYSQAEKLVDDEIMNAGKGTPFAPQFREASAQWSELKDKYDTAGREGTVLSSILKTRDPAQVTKMLLGRQSAADVQLMKNEGMDGALEALRHQVINKIATSNFSVARGQLGGFSDTFLQSLFDTSKPVANPMWKGVDAEPHERFTDEGLRKTFKIPESKSLLELQKEGMITRDANGFYHVPKEYAPLPSGTPPALKELALKADIARRVKFQMNPSGTGNILLGASQIRHPILEGIPLAIAGRMSFPRDPLSFLPPEAAPGVPGGTVPLKALANPTPFNRRLNPRP